MNNSDILVVIPHSGIGIPAEINPEYLSEDFTRLAQNVDWYTNWLYDFRDILANRHLVFPYCSIIVEANRHPDILDDCVPLTDVNNHPVYRENSEPSLSIRQRIANTYLNDFHKSIEDNILSGANFLFDGHSTISARGVVDNQIDLMNFQHSRLDKEKRYFCPDIYIETYAAELRKRLPEVKVTVNASEYYTVYGHVCSAHSVNAMGRSGNRVPAILQETNERLYRHPDKTPDVLAINRLRRAFAESLSETMKFIHNN